MNDTMKQLYDVICSRQETYTEGSYTCYLFEQGLDKILKKCGEECSETIIAAKNLEAWQPAGGGLRPPSPPDEKTTGESFSGRAAARADLENEICDLIYHLMVMMAACDIPLEDVDAILQERSAKIGNLKQMRRTDRLT